MPDAQPPIFNRKAAERLRSPDDLERYVKVTTPSVWVALAAVFALMAGVLVWGIFGAVSTSVSATGTCVNGTVQCMLSAQDVAKVKVGDAAYVDGHQMKVASVSEVPLSFEDASNQLGSAYLADALMASDWAYPVTFAGATGFNERIPLTVNITTDRVAPITLLFG